MNLIPATCSFLAELVQEALLRRDLHPNEFFPGYERFLWMAGTLDELSKTSNYRNGRYSIYSFILPDEEQKRRYLDAYVPPGTPPRLAIVFCMIRQAMLVPIGEIDLNGLRNAFVNTDPMSSVAIIFPPKHTGTCVGDDARHAILSYFVRGCVGNRKGGAWYVRIHPEEDAPILVYNKDPDEEDCGEQPLFALPLSLFPELELRRETEGALNDDGLTCGNVDDMPGVDTEERSDTPLSPPLKTPTSYWLLDTRRSPPSP